MDAEMGDNGHEVESDDSSDEDSDQEVAKGGRDRLEATEGMDIPHALNIPIVSQLAKQ